MDPDLILLRRHAGDGDKKAFEELVARHVNTVYASALRQIRDPNDAEDITQAVFILLAKKGAKLSDKVLIGGWLILATRFAAKEVLRAKRRRIIHEERAAAMKPEAQQSSVTEIESVLDEALARISAKNRGVLVMRYIEGREVQDVAQTLGISEIATRKRVSRALGELRSVIASAGVTVSEQMLGENLAHASVAAPAGLAASAAASTAKPAAAALAKVVGISIAAGGAKFAIGGALIAVVLVAGVVGVVKETSQPAQPTASNAPAAAAAANVPAAKISGVIYGADQTPIADAEVLLAADTPVDVYQDNPKIPKTQSDAQGRYSLPMPQGSYSVVVRSVEGFADISSETIKRTNADIMIKPWARVEGVAMIGNKPATGKTIRIWKDRRDDPERGDVQYQTTTRADDQGHFHFEIVPPGEHLFSIEPPFNGQAHKWDYQVLEPGETLHETLGGTGRAVVGRAVIPKSISQPISFKTEPGRIVECSANRVLNFNNQGPLRGDDPHLTPEEFDAKRNSWGKTPQGKHANIDSFEIFGQVNDDGTFRFDDLAPGRYRVQVRTMEPNQEVIFYEDVTRATGEFTIPEIPGGRSDEPLDIGNINTEVLPQLKPGDLAPEFSVETIDGKTWKLSDHIGKPVVLLFWRAQGFADFKPLAEKISELVKSGRVSAIGFDLEDAAADEALKKAAKYELQWPQAVMQREVIDKYLGSIVTAVVIDGKGRIVQRMLTTPEQIEKFVARAEHD